MRANTIVVIGVIAVALAGGASLLRVKGLHADGSATVAAPPVASAPVDTAPAAPQAVPLSGRLHEVTLPYYVVREGEGDPVLVERTTSLKAAGSVSIWRQARTALNALASFPQTEGSLRNPMPAGARFLGVHVANNGIATVDLSPRFRDNFNGGAREEQVTIYAIVNTVGAVKGVHGVSFSIAGIPIDEFAGHLDLSSPLVPDPSLVEPAR